MRVPTGTPAKRRGKEGTIIFYNYYFFSDWEALTSSPTSMVNTSKWAGGVTLSLSNDRNCLFQMMKQDLDPDLLALFSLHSLHTLLIQSSIVSF